MSDDDFFGNILNLYGFGKNFSFGRLREPVVRNDWIYYGHTANVNAYYNRIENSMRK